jgi:hypothetical protein
MPIDKVNDNVGVPSKAAPLAMSPATATGPNVKNDMPKYGRAIGQVGQLSRR